MSGVSETAVYEAAVRRTSILGDPQEDELPKIFSWVWLNSPGIHPDLIRSTHRRPEGNDKKDAVEVSEVEITEAEVEIAEATKIFA